MRFTVLIPTHNHGETIRFAIRSVLRQTVADWSLVVIGDGAPANMAQIVAQEGHGDGRIAYRAFPKGERHGEAWRHEVLQGANSDAVAYLGDDDFWLPTHLQVLRLMLQRADFAHTRQTEVLQTGSIFSRPGSLSETRHRLRLLRDPPGNFFGPTVVGHRLDAYRRLPVGWSPAPPGLWTDLHMWRKWLRAPNMRFAGSPSATAIKIGAAPRANLAASERSSEIERIWKMFSNPAVAEGFPRLNLLAGNTTPLAEALLAALRLGVAMPGRSGSR
jgi:hypothetical protein